jgi:hypothetical protein
MLTQEGALSGLVQQHLKSRGKHAAFQRQNRAKLLMKKTLSNPNGNANGSSGEKLTKSVKRKRTVAGKKKARKKK